jgi:hypothetical protein
LTDLPIADLAEDAEPLVEWIVRVSNDEVHNFDTIEKDIFNKMTVETKIFFVLNKTNIILCYYFIQKSGIYIYYEVLPCFL